MVSSIAVSVTMSSSNHDVLCLAVGNFKEAYIYSDEHDLELEYEQSIMGTLRSTSTMKYDDHEFISADDISLSDIYTPCSTSNPISRYSMVSRTSSTTTSGIVSDRTCLSTEVSQGETIRRYYRLSNYCIVHPYCLM